MTKQCVKFALIVGVVILFWSECYSQKEPKVSFPVPLNHFYITVDSETYSVIEKSDFLKNQFAAFERRTTVRTDKTYTGIYFYGRHTYFEFFDSEHQSEFKLGDSGIAFGVDEEGAGKKLQTILGAGEPKLVTRGYQDKQIPWFSMLSLDLFPPHSALTSWIMEYHPDFLRQWNPMATGENGILREQVLTRYRNVLPSSPATPILEDVVGLTVATDETSIARLKDTCVKFGYLATTEGEAVVLAGPDITLRLIKESQTVRGIRAIDFRVRKGNFKSPQTFGRHSRLEFRGDGRAIWIF
jgi:hypothetical protein